MTEERNDGLKSIQYVGLPRLSNDCQAAVLRIIQYGERITNARILTDKGCHCFLLTVNVGDLVAVRSGFTSGYHGGGPYRFSYVLQLLDAHGAEIEEYEVATELVERLDASCLTQEDLDGLEREDPVRPARWYDYLVEQDWDREADGTLWRNFPLVIPYALIDTRIADLAREFWDDPGARLMDGYSRLEDNFRRRTGLQEHGQSLFSQGLRGQRPPLEWKDIPGGEHEGRTNMFIGAFMAHRNPRAHRELKNDSYAQLSELLLLNHLFRLEAELTPVEREEPLP